MSKLISTLQELDTLLEFYSYAYGLPSEEYQECVGKIRSLEDAAIKLKYEMKNTIVSKLLKEGE